MNNDIKILKEETITDEDILMEAKALENEKKLNSKLFKKPNDAEYIYKKRDRYEILALNLLFMYLGSHQYEWFVKFERKGSKLYIMNSLCPENIKTLKVLGIENYDQFIGALLELGKFILVESDLDRELDEVEQNERYLKAHEVALQYKKD
jgi:hypothetical protein